MSLPAARKAVREALPSGHSRALVERVIEWFSAYKTWEATDTIGKAFHDRRLTIRTYNKPEETGSKWNVTYASNQTKDAGRTRDWAGQPQDVSGRSVFARTNPLHFAPGPGEKYSLGLHDLSASLLDPEKDISNQLYHALNTEAKDGSYVIFMPLPDEEDLQLFHDLNTRAKDLRAELPAFHDLIRLYRSRITRIKQAYEYDIGAGFSATPRVAQVAGKPEVKFKYGVGEKLKVVGKILPVNTTPGLNDEAVLKRNALSYRRILRESPTKGKYNEITISYRQHASPRFPQAAIWRFARREFECVKIDGKGEDRAIIRDRPAREQ